MADTRWTGGANDGNWGTAGNWDTSGGGSAPPANGDNVFIDATSQNIIGGLTTIPATGSLGVLTISPGFKGTIGGGSSGSANIAAATVNISLGGGPVYLGTGTRTRTNIDNTGRSTVFITGGTNTTIATGKNASVEIGASATCNVLKGGGSIRAAYNATGFRTVVISGLLTTARPIEDNGGAETCEVSQGGTVICTDTTTANACFNLKISGGGRWQHQAKGNIPTLTMYPDSQLDPYGGVYSFTVGATALEYHAGARLVREADGVTVTVSTAAQDLIGTRSSP